MYRDLDAWASRLRSVSIILFFLYLHFHACQELLLFTVYFVPTETNIWIGLPETPISIPSEMMMMMMMMMPLRIINLKSYRVAMN